mmetsp:Transcript_83938/g.237771  ORF Transcript_83938/g.237771 Transcript_83938/m.237771 type:complete len:271 (-) Transcript_83938:4-816(-)
MSRDPIEGTPSGEAPAAIQAVGLDKLVRLALQALADLGHGEPGADVRLRVPPHLAVALGRQTDLVVVVLVEPLQLPLLSGRGAESVVLRVLLNLPYRVVRVGVLVGHRDTQLGALPPALDRGPVAQPSEHSVVLLGHAELLASGAARGVIRTPSPARLLLPVPLLFLGPSAGRVVAVFLLLFLGALGILCLAARGRCVGLVFGIPRVFAAVLLVGLLFFLVFLFLRRLGLGDGLQQVLLGLVGHIAVQPLLAARPGQDPNLRPRLESKIA